MQSMAKSYTTNPIFLVMTEAHLSATFGSNILDFVYLSLHWVSVVRVQVNNYEIVVKIFHISHNLT